MNIALLIVTNTPGKVLLIDETGKGVGVTYENALYFVLSFPVNLKQLKK